jgi:hypothetical protein
MATRSTIALEFADGTVGQVYCHWDGYLEHNGAILFKHYSDPFKLQQLIDTGDLSILGPDIGEPHSFDNPFSWGTPESNNWHEANKKVCTFYGRDRGETGIDARYFNNFEHYKKNHQYEEYEYILRQVDGQAVWFVCYNDKYVELATELKETV